VSDSLKPAGSSWQRKGQACSLLCHRRSCLTARHDRTLVDAAEQAACAGGLNALTVLSSCAPHTRAHWLRCRHRLLQLHSCRHYTAAPGWELGALSCAASADRTAWALRLAQRAARGQAGYESTGCSHHQAPKGCKQALLKRALVDELLVCSNRPASLDPRGSFCLHKLTSFSMCKQHTKRFAILRWSARLAIPFVRPRQAALRL